MDEPTTDGLNGLGAVESPNQATSYTYDLLNNLKTVTQGSQARTFNYDALSRLTSAVNPESGTISYGYDSNGNLTSKVDARGITTSYAYDALNRVTQRSYSTPSGTPSNYQAAPNVTYFYDNLTNAKGKLVKVTNGTGVDRSTTEYLSFDILGRVTRSKQTTDGVEYGGGGNASNWMTYTYNWSGALIEQQYPSGRVVRNELDTNGDLSRVQSKKYADSGYWNYAQNFTYAASGAVTSMQLGNGTWEKTRFNSRLQPDQIALGTVQGGTNKLQLDYSYGNWTTGGTIDGSKNNGNIVQQVITVPDAGTVGLNGFTATQKYYYDELNRIDDSTEHVGITQKWRQDFTYDRYGNRNFVQANTTMPASFANPAVTNPTISTSNNRITSTGWLYDSAGNTTRDGDYKTFTYDGENKQVIVKNSSNVTIGEYWYDGDGKRVKKRSFNPSTNETEETIFVYDASGKLIEEYSTKVETLQTAEVAYLTNDHLGSPRINTDRDGDVTSRHDYHPFGEEILTTERGNHSEYTPDSVRKQFTGYERDGETELDFAEARSYSSGLGRFSVVDPMLASASMANPQTFNRYSYVMNQPTVMIDPSGLAGCSAENSYSDCGGDDGFWGGDFGDEVASWKKKSGGATGEAANFLARVFSVRETGWDPEMNRYWGDVSLEFIGTNGYRESVYVGHNPTLDQVFEKSLEITNGIRRNQARAAMKELGWDKYNLTLEASGEGFRVTAKDRTARNFLDGETGSSSFHGSTNNFFFNSHKEEAGCGVCVDYRSRRGVISHGSMQVVYNAAAGTAYVDVDRYAPHGQGIRGFLGHVFLEGLANAGSPFKNVRGLRYEGFPRR